MHLHAPSCTVADDFEQLYTAAQKVLLQGTSASDALAAAWTVISPILQGKPAAAQ